MPLVEAFEVMRQLPMAADQNGHNLARTEGATALMLPQNVSQSGDLLAQSFDTIEELHPVSTYQLESLDPAHITIIGDPKLIKSVIVFLYRFFSEKHYAG